MAIEEQILCFVAEFTGVERAAISSTTLINDHLGVDGDDAAELIAEFSQKFNVDLSNYENEFFGPEGFNPLTLLFHGVAALVGGILGKPETHKPLPISHLVKSAEAQEWLAI